MIFEDNTTYKKILEEEHELQKNKNYFDNKKRF